MRLNQDFWKIKNNFQGWWRLFICIHIELGYYYHKFLTFVTFHVKENTFCVGKIPQNSLCLSVLTVRSLEGSHNDWVEPIHAEQCSKTSQWLDDIRKIIVLLIGHKIFKQLVTTRKWNLTTCLCFVFSRKGSFGVRKAFSVVWFLEYFATST